MQRSLTRHRRQLPLSQSGVNRTGPTYNHAKLGPEIEDSERGLVDGLALSGIGEILYFSATAYYVLDQCVEEIR